ncbi:MAG: hypothetical protein U9N53_15275, partial [Bacteroidota bacterium]|nr:hypothetical protein [Bacteroidota bacterium]
MKIKNMKTRFLIAIAITALFISSCGNNNSKKETDKSTADTTVSFNVNNPDEWPVKFSDFGFTPKTYAQAESYSFMEDFIGRSGINNFFHFKTLAKM